MLKKIGLLIGLVISITLLSFQFIKTQLRITIYDDVGNSHENVEVSLYETAEDYNNDKVAFGPLKTNKRGKVVFHGVEEGPYYVEAKKGDLSNTFGGEQTSKLLKGKINKVVIIIE